MAATESVQDLHLVNLVKSFGDFVAVDDLTLTIPEGVHAVVTINGGLSNINANGTWNISSNRYECGSGGPTINITVEMAVGNLNLNQN